jgi:hypothetical protein
MRISGSLHRNLGDESRRLVGGFVGRNSGTIKESFAAGIVDAKASNAGGFSGWNEGTIECCYANCYTYAWNRAAGFAVTTAARSTAASP